MKHPILKKLLVTSATAMLAMACFGQGANLVHLYEFNGSFADSLGGPALVNNGGTLSGGSLLFGANQGPTLDIESDLAGDYSIGLRFSFDAVSGYRKIVDYQDRTADYGMYLDSGVLTLYNYSWVGTTALNPSQTVDLVLTRDGASGVFTAYLNGSTVPEFSITDSGSLAVATNGGGFARFQFLRDDFLQGTEASGGTLQELRVWDGALAAGEIPNAFMPVPEPGTMALFAGGLLMLWARVRSRRQN